METIIYSVCIAFVLLELIPIKKYINKKPFNCGPCLSGWASILICWYLHESFLLIPVAMVAYIIFEKIIYSSWTLKRNP